MKLSCADFATVVTGKLFVEVGRLYEIYNALTGDQLYTHQLPRAFHFCQDRIAGQHPQIAGAMQAAAGFVNNKTYLPMLGEWVTRYGDEFEVAPVEGWRRRDPLQEAIEMVGADKTIVVSV